MSAEDGGWDLGGFVPVGYEVTPWATLFPQLAKFASSPTLKTGYIAKMYTFYLTRLQFGQYLHFLGDVGPDVCGNDAITQDIQTYERSCEDLLGDIEAHATGKNVDAASYASVVQSFEDMITSAAPAPQKFYSEPVYQTFFSHYTFFTGCAYGFINGGFGNSLGKYLTVRAPNLFPDAPLPTNPPTLLPALADALRFYPVVTRDGGVIMTFFDDGVQQFIPKLADGPSEDTSCLIYDLPELRDAAGFRYNSYQPRDGGNLIWDIRFYPVGLEDVPDDYTGQIRGVPMITTMPFDFLGAYAAGAHQTNTVVGARARQGANTTTH